MNFLVEKGTENDLIGLNDIVEEEEDDDEGNTSPDTEIPEESSFATTRALEAEALVRLDRGLRLGGFFF